MWLSNCKVQKKNQMFSNITCLVNKTPDMSTLASHLSDKQKDDYGKLLKEFSDIFAWQYDDLKTFDTEVIQHKIPLNKDTKPFHQKMRSFNPLLLPMMEKEIRKLLDARIIIPSQVFRVDC